MYEEDVREEAKQLYLMGWCLTEISRIYDGAPSIATLCRWKAEEKWDELRREVVKKTEKKLIEQTIDLVTGLENGIVHLLVDVFLRIRKMIEAEKLSAKDMYYYISVLEKIDNMISKRKPETGEINWIEIEKEIEKMKQLNEKNGM